MTVALTEASAAPARILIHGHRGARAVRPENTLPAFEYAIQAGADVLELDLSVTKDDVLVVSHDPILPEALCTGGGVTRVIRQMTLAELKKWDCGSLKNPAFPKQQTVPGTRVPTLDEVLALAPRGSFEFNIETKIDPRKPELTPTPERFSELLLAALRKHKVEKRVIVQSFDFRTLHEMAKLDASIRLSALDAFGNEDFVAVARRAGTKIVSPEKRLVTPEKVKAAHDAGLQVVPWTANTESDWERLIAAGVDAIISDDPAAALQYLRDRSR